MQRLLHEERCARFDVDRHVRLRWQPLSRGWWWCLLVAGCASSPPAAPKRTAATSQTAASQTTEPAAPPSPAASEAVAASEPADAAAPPPTAAPSQASSKPHAPFPCDAILAHLVKLNVAAVPHWEEAFGKQYRKFIRSACNGPRWSPAFAACLTATRNVQAIGACEDAEYKRSPVRSRCEAIAKAMTAHKQAQLDREHPDAAATYGAIATTLEEGQIIQCVTGTWSDTDLACLEAAKTTADEERCVGAVQRAIQ